MTTMLGATVIYGGQTSISGYINLTENVGPGDVSSEDVENADGKKVTRLVFQVMPKLTLTLVATTGTFAEFVEGAMCTATGWTAYYIDSLSIAKVKGARQGTVNLTSIFN